MTFSTSLKEEMSKSEINSVEAHFELSAFFKYASNIGKNISITLENASVARRIYKEIKSIFNITPSITIRNQRRFRVKQIYIITINNKVDFIKDSLELKTNSITLDDREEKIAFIRGAFLAIGNVSNPQTSGYHLEFICDKEKDAKYLIKILKDLSFNSKYIKRGYKFVVYFKSAEQISDLIKLFKATNALFFFEDIRIYRDHKNMVNRLNNCEISNQVKAVTSGLKQLEGIKYLKENDLMSIVDDKLKIVLEVREKYPEVSLSELADIITLEYNYKIGKSGVNHHFIKMNNIIKNHRKNNENK